MMQEGSRVDFSFWEAGCMIWVGSLDAYAEFCHAWSHRDGNVIRTDREAIKRLIFDRKAVMPMALYQDDGYVTRVAIGDLDEREREDWTARVRWQLNLPTGQLVVSGIVVYEEEILSLEESDPDELLQCYLEVPPGKYVVEVYSYPPDDLSTGWGQIEDPDLFSPTDGIEPEDLLDYFNRTRSDETMPSWLGIDFATTKEERKHYAQVMEKENSYVNFVVRLTPELEELPMPKIDDEDGDVCLQWEFRKPDRFPLGVISNLPDGYGWEDDEDWDEEEDEDIA